jgi:hypothetical protein
LADHVDCYLQHGQIEAAQALVRQRLGSAATLSDITLPDGTPAAEAVIRLDEALLRYRLTLSGVQPWLTRRPSRFIGFAEPFSSRPRPPRKGAATKQTQVIR